MDVKYFPFDTQVKFIFVLVKDHKSIVIRIEYLSPTWVRRGATETEYIWQAWRRVLSFTHMRIFTYYPALSCNTLLFYDRNTKCLGNILSSSILWK